VKLLVEFASSIAGRVTDKLELPSKQTLPFVVVKFTKLFAPIVGRGEGRRRSDGFAL
jgi:hypothetical protein